MSFHRASPLLRQATLRLLLSLLTALLLIGGIGWGVYIASERKAVEIETRAIFGFYENKLKEWENQWEKEAARTKSRLEFTRLLEDPNDRWTRLYSYLTVQGEQQAFQNVLVTDADDRVLFRFGPERVQLASRYRFGTAEERPVSQTPEKINSWWYFDAASNELSRVYQQDVWLGAQGMGHLILLRRLDNALLYQNTATNTDLFLLWQGKAVAGSLAGEPGDVADGNSRRNNIYYSQRNLKWDGTGNGSAHLLVRHKTPALFSVWQLAFGGLLASLALFGILWGTLGLWLIRVSRRIGALGKVSRIFGEDYQHSEEIAKQLAVAGGGGGDEIDKVADSLEYLTVAVLQRDQERRAKEDALAESEARIREITESLADGVFVVDSGGRITFVNPQATKLLGYHPQELLSQDSHSTLHHTRPDGSSVPIELCPVHQAVIQGKAFRTPEDFFIRKDGAYLPVSVAATPILRNGETVGSVVTFQDITERKRAEAEYRTLMQTTPDAFWLVCAQSGRLLDVNAAACAMVGYPREELLSMRINDLEALLDEDEIVRRMKTLMQGEPLRFESRHRRRDGSVIDVEVSSRYLDVRGGVIVAFIRDITLRKQDEKKITELLDLNSKIIDESTLGIKAFRADGQCVSANEAAARILEQDSENLLRENFHQLPFWKTTGLLEVAEEVLKDNVSRHKEIHTFTASGKEIWLECDLTYFTSAGDPHLLALLHDVTEFRRAERSLTEARQAAERANLAKSEFLANMSHEIRTPMNAIIGLSDLALGLELPPNLRDYFAKINSSSKALLSIINDILDYSKVEAGRLELDSVEFRLEEMLENVANLFNVRAEEKGLELLFQIGGDVPQILIGDPLRLSQVMNNLVGNAVKFTEKGQIHIQIERVTATPGQAGLRFSIRDSGIGMTPEQTERLFQAFTQADGSITRKYGGTGLGLTISKRLVEKMGGDISVSSAPGQGSTFTFTLTFPVPQHAVLTRSATDLRGMHVLVVDDLDISRRILTELLTQWGFRVSEAASGRQALELLEKADNPAEPVELVLLDWKMPEMDGIEMARRVHQLADTHGIPRLPVIIMVTAHSKEQLLEEARDVRLDAVLTKPVTPSGLFDAIIRFQGGQVLEAVEDIQPDLRTKLSAIQGAHILLVEDNEINRQVAREFLERSGMEVSVAENGEEALSALQREAFDIVLMDLQMPVMDGLEATRRIRQEERLRDLPVIAMTAAVMAQDREDCFAAGMNGHIAKPILPDELREALLKYIKPHQLMQEKTTRLIRADIQMTPLPDELPGFALHGALELLGANRPLLKKLLLQFALQFAPAAQEIAGLIREGKRQEAAERLHRIKGAAANLGATALQQAAAALENQLSAGLPPGGEAAFAQALAQALDAIATLDDQTEEAARKAKPEECEKCDWRRAEELASQLRELLEGNDFVPHEMMNEFKEAVGCQFFRGKLAALQRLVDSFDYNNALTMLASLECAQGHRLKGG